MSEKTVQYGPFTPQELDSFVRELQTKNIPFDVHKDEEEEKRFKRNDFVNMVTRTHYRTEQYLGQIFYITLAKKDLQRVKESLQKLGFPTDLPEFPAELQSDVSEDIFVKARSEKSKFNRRMAAWVLLIGLLCTLFISYALSILSQP